MSRAQLRESSYWWCGGYACTVQHKTRDAAEKCPKRTPSPRKQVDLSERNSRIWGMVIDERRPIAEVASKFHLSSQRVSQIVKKRARGLVYEASRPKHKRIADWVRQDAKAQ